jgi:hypothetical protein
MHFSQSSSHACTTSVAPPERQLSTAKTERGSLFVCPAWPADTKESRGEPFILHTARQGQWSAFAASLIFSSIASSCRSQYAPFPVGASLPPTTILTSLRVRTKALRCGGSTFSTMSLNHFQFELTSYSAQILYRASCIGPPKTPLEISEGACPSQSQFNVQLGWWLVAMPSVWILQSRGGGWLDISNWNWLFAADADG